MLVIESPEEMEDIEGIETSEDGNTLIRIPHLIPQMTTPDRVTILEWHVKEDEIIIPDNLMVTLDFLGDDWYIPVPPLGGPLRVVKIKATEGKILHLYDPLIVLAPVEALSSVSHK